MILTKHMGYAMQLRTFEHSIYAFLELGGLTVLPQCSRPGKHETTRNALTAIILQAFTSHLAQRATLDCNYLTLGRLSSTHFACPLYDAPMTSSGLSAKGTRGCSARGTSSGTGRLTQNCEEIPSMHIPSWTTTGKRRSNAFRR